ncbi:MAG TPA: hypothetical protein VG500_16835 [Gemmatimonadales bacterium]|nr:hypothetical protein [Gemmatimonadales bacterium]
MGGTCGRTGAAGRGGAPPIAGACAGATGRDGVAAGAIGLETGGGAAGAKIGGAEAGGGDAGGDAGGGVAGGGIGAATGAAATGAVAARTAAAGGGAATSRPSRLTAKTALHTAQRARTPAAGTLAGSTR